MNVPRNYSNDFDHRKQFRGLDSRLLPNGSVADAGKIAKIDETGKWALANDENTIIVGNPDEPASVELENLKIGNTVYAVNEPHFEVIKGFRITIADGGQYRTDKPKIEFYDDAGIVASIPSSSYTASCDKEYAGNINMENVCSIATTDAPATFTYEFNDDFSITNYHLIKFTNAGSFAGDIAKNISLELTSDGENWVEIWSDIGLSWTTSGAYKIIDLNSGEESETILPIVTSADNGAILRVVNGVWTKELLTKGSVINAQTDTILMYCSSANFSGTTPDISFDLQYHSGYKCDTARFIDVSNLKVMLLLNGKLVAFNQPFNDVFEFVPSSSTLNAPWVAKRGDISWFLALKSAYASQLTVSDIKKYDFVYFRFMSAIVLDNPIST